MTKKELMENKYWKEIPDDTVIVINPTGREGDYAPVEFENITFHSEIVGWIENDRCNFKTRQPIMMRLLEIKVR